MDYCSLCPRECGSDRSKKAGFCGGADNVKLARATLHYWEEPCISGKNGSGTVFFSGCPLKCVFCQNYDISNGNFGKEISVSRLAEIFIELQEQGANNINLVSPTQYVPWICEALKISKSRLVIPVVYNTGGYEKVGTLKMLEGLIDIYLPDIKYISSERSMKYSQAADYFEYASKAVLEMYRQTGRYVLNNEGLMKSGVMIRHLVLPMGRHDTESILKWIAANFKSDEVLVSLMSQYTPCRELKYSELNRRICTFEYNSAVNKAVELGFKGYTQSKNSSDENYIPNFDLQGV